MTANPIHVTPSLEARFWRYVTKSDGCWTWGGFVTDAGYGRFFLGRRKGHRPAHRFAYTALRGEIPLDMTLDHLCRNKLCVNPAHLEIVTLRTNILRSMPRDAHREDSPNDHPRANARIAHRRYRAEYMRRRRAKRRLTIPALPHVRGERVASAKLTAEIVQDIRAARATGEYLHVIAKRFGISETQTRCIVHGQS